jgi:hypothetical protein
MQGRGYFWDLQEDGNIKMYLIWAWKCRLTPFTVAQDKDQAIPVASKSWACVYGRSLAGISG